MLNNQQLDEWLVDPSGATGVVGVRIDSDHRELSDIWQPDDLQDSQPKASLEQRLQQGGVVSAEQMEQAKKIHQKTPRKLLGQILLEMGVVSEEQLLECLAQQYDLTFIRITSEMVSPSVVHILDPAYIESHNVLPLAMEDGKLVVATSDPTNVFLLDEVRRKVKKTLLVKVCPSSDIRHILQSRNDRTGDFKLDEIIDDIRDDDVEIVATQEEDIADLERAAGDSPIIKFVNYIIFNAVKEGASDIHIEPGDKRLKVRSRIDGVLFEMVSPPYAMHPAIVSRIKIMANLDIAERRLPQDGRIRVVVNSRDVDMRVSTLPTTHGEKVVIRILSSSGDQLTLTDLGMEAENLAILGHHIDQPHGIILVTGPTGSGKSTTLFSALRTMDSKQMNISTVEDPVEYQMEGISQVQVHESIGMSFAAALRSLLRQDPDVILVGEIRDEETARIAVQASLTGHLVLSTLHTNDAPSSITRLINIGIEPYLIAASTNAVLAQRLVRRVCRHCRQLYEPDAQYIGFMKMYGFAADKLIRGTGCEHCRHTGFQGRIGLFEMLSLDDTYRDIITKSPSVTELRRLCKERGMITLRDDGFRKVQAGHTTIDEVMKATESTI